MKRAHRALPVLLVAASFMLLFSAVAVLKPRPWLIWNASASAPIGLYQLTPLAHSDVGMLIAIRPPTRLARFLAARRYLPLGVPLLKHIAAQPGARICRRGAVVSIDSRAVATALADDRQGRRLPVWRGCSRVRAGQLFLLNAAPDSMDGRYFGPIPAAGLLGRATPLLTRPSHDRPLRWHGFVSASASSPPTKG